ncbi:MAG: tricarballylate utilization 4Fe-4S protein TcuB [Rhodospirillales bacterium]|nr:tricarballylate utilization 4Fe-4S protein TcuB [Rhodospirillales bacterium]MBO6788709.1 tricarballylate utilization 4Fe-4S protein TcuB [Rhodospirillales bacterium]
MPETETLQEAKRVMQICNACRYCEGYCAVFPAMNKRLTFSDGDVTYLANLCHGCQGCYYACQYAPPHEFAVNVPKAFAELRAETYRDYAWPGIFKGLFEGNGKWVALITLVLTIAVTAGVFMVQGADVVAGVHTGTGAFYKVIPHDVIVYLASAPFLFAGLAFIVGLVTFWRDIGGKPGELLHPGALAQALKDAGQMKYMSGGGHGCNYPNDNFSMGRRHAHQMTMWGFLLCFAATSVATLYHYAFGWEAPYDYFSIPVILGTLGGIGIVIGPIGLLMIKKKADPAPQDTKRTGMDVAFLWLLMLTGITGLALLALRETAAMGTLLAVHLGIVLGMFVTFPYGKMVHAVYRLGALIKFAHERRS